MSTDPSLTLHELDAVLALARRHDVAELHYRGAVVRLRPATPAARERVEDDDKPRSIEDAIDQDPAFEAFRAGFPSTLLAR